MYKKSLWSRLKPGWRVFLRFLRILRSCLSISCRGRHKNAGGEGARKRAKQKRAKERAGGGSA